MRWCCGLPGVLASGQRYCRKARLVAQAKRAKSVKPHGAGIAVIRLFIRH